MSPSLMEILLLMSSKKQTLINKIECCFIQGCHNPPVYILHLNLSSVKIPSLLPNYVFLCEQCKHNLDSRLENESSYYQNCDLVLDKTQQGLTLKIVSKSLNGQ